MPKITVHGGPSYEGHVDVTPHDVTEPEWRPAPPEQAPVERPADKPAPRARTRKRAR